MGTCVLQSTFSTVVPSLGFQILSWEDPRPRPRTKELSRKEIDYPTFLSLSNQVIELDSSHTS